MIYIVKIYWNVDNNVNIYIYMYFTLIIIIVNKDVDKKGPVFTNRVNNKCPAIIFVFSVIFK